MHLLEKAAHITNLCEIFAGEFEHIGEQAIADNLSLQTTEIEEQMESYQSQGHDLAEAHEQRKATYCDLKLLFKDLQDHIIRQPGHPIAIPATHIDIYHRARFILKRYPMKHHPELERLSHGLEYFETAQNTLLQLSTELGLKQEALELRLLWLRKDLSRGKKTILSSRIAQKFLSQADLQRVQSIICETKPSRIQLNEKSRPKTSSELNSMLSVLWSRSFQTEAPSQAA